MGARTYKGEEMSTKDLNSCPVSWLIEDAEIIASMLDGYVRAIEDYVPSSHLEEYDFIPAILDMANRLRSVATSAARSSK